MANSIKYNTGTEASALRMGNFHMGVGNVSKGPTSTTGYYSAVNPPPGGYTIYVHNKNIGPSIQIASNDAELIRITNTIASASYTTINECFQYFNGQTDKMVVNSPINSIVTDGLVLILDAGIIPSYPKSGTSWKDLSGEDIDGTLYNGPVFNSNGFLEFDGVDDYAIIGSANDIQFGTGDFTIEALFKPIDDGSGWTGVVAKGASGATGFAMNYYANGNGTVTLRMSITAPSNEHYSSGFLTSDKWYHIVMVFDRDTAGYVYNNGDLTYSHTALTSNNQTVDNSGYPLRLSTFGGGSWFLNGDIAKVKLYNKVLSNSEVSQNYYQAPIVTDGLIFAIDAGNLPSYENGSTTAYSLTGSFSGSLTNGTGYSSDNGGVFTFDGNDDRIDNFSENIEPSAITIEYWKKWTAVSDDWLIGNQTSNPIDNNNGFYHRIDSPSYNFIARFGVGTTNRSVTYNPIVLNEWTHVVTTFNSSEGAKLYWNGVLVSSNTSGGTISYSNVLGLEIGGANDGSRDTPGPVGPVRIYDRALTAGEVMQNYSAGKGRFSS